MGSMVVFVFVVGLVNEDEAASLTVSGVLVWRCRLSVTWFHSEP